MADLFRIDGKTVDETAMQLAKQHNLICEDGTITCWNCRNRPALMPSLHCPACLGSAYVRLGIVAPQRINREQP